VHQAEARQKSLVDDVRAHPMVAAVLARFPGAEIVDVRYSKAEPATEVSDDALADPEITDDDF
jgi:DNA polymerase-3 subunit gamma/tau